MPNNKDIFHNKKDFTHEEFATELYRTPGRPRGREVKSQKAQLESSHRHGERKDVKTPMSDKT